MDYIWKIPHTPISDEQKNLCNKLNINPIVMQILFNRGFCNEVMINSFISQSKPSNVIYDPNLIKDLSKAVARIADGVKIEEKIIIYGDYDVDGITSSALLYLFFQVYRYYKKSNIEVEVILPERVFEGYGLKKEGIVKAIEKGAKLIITVDNGTSSYEAIEYARDNNIDVIVVDHHSIPEILPPAYAIINTRQEECKYPFKGLSAVGLVYKLTDALSNTLLDELERKRFLERYIDYVAIGTYQDLAPLCDENRYFVKRGIEVIEKIKVSGQTNLRGIIELLRVSGKINEKIDYNTLGFCIGPQINAAGRIDTPMKAFRLLTTIDLNEAKLLAKELNEINNIRKIMTKEAYEEAVLNVEGEELYNDNIILLVSNHWHQGIIGLVAQKIAETYNKSCIVMTDRDKDYYTASARGYRDFDIGNLIKNLGKYFIYFGGHKKAAGFSMQKENLDEFRKELFRQLKNEENLSGSQEIYIDVIIDFRDLNYNLIEDLKKLEPYGESNPEPVFGILEVVIESVKESKRGLDSLIRISKNGDYFNLISFNEINYLKNFKSGDVVDVAIKISANKNSNKDMLIQICDIRKNKII
ncbi:MAG: single-stranded-DNA-specific exonuclease RecJ [Spirochaetota bacterium]|nr:single-stranded-DNA-specific exonuclease RecJ [Spirochaetota bacterium]